MKMPCTVLLLFTASLVSASEVKLRVVDDTGAPMKGVSAWISFYRGSVLKEDKFEGGTDAQGRFSGAGTALGPVVARVFQDGYHTAFLRDLSNDQDLDLTVVMRKVLKPIPLFALRANIGVYSLENPRPGLKSVDEYGYDLEAGEMMPPHGKGITEDIHFRVTTEFVRWGLSEYQLEESRRHPLQQGASEAQMRMQFGIWQSSMEVSFPSGGGCVEVTDAFHAYSEMKMPHQAPEDGYVSSRSFRTNLRAQPESNHEKWDTGYFLRTRVKLDESGRVISANYAKVLGGFFLYWGGYIAVNYAYNPTPNDRHLEFDWSRNLFPPEKMGARFPYR